jgi:DNA-binding transcriptional LysR family regulator
MNSQTTPGFDWRLVRSFLATLETGSLLGAARQLRISQPTVGRHIAVLETQLGAPLFERTGRGLRPTPAAAAIAEAARMMDLGADAIGRAVSGLDERPTGTVRIAASQLAACYLLPPILADLRRREPGIAIEVVASNALTNLLRREADIAVRMARPVQSSLIARRIGTVQSGIYANEDYLRRRPAPSTVAELLKHDLIGLDREDDVIREFRAAGLAATRDNFVLRSDDHIVLAVALNAGLGVGFGPTYLQAAYPGLRRILPEVALPALPVWLAVHREIQSTRRIRTAYDFLAAAIPDALRRRASAGAAPLGGGKGTC